MASCIRSSAHIARASRRAVSRSRFTSPAPAACSLSSASPFTGSQVSARRRYATQPDNKDKDKQKPAPGTEHLYNKDSALSQSSKDGKATASRLTPEEEESLQQVVNLISKGMPRQQRDDLKRVHQMIRRDGLPPELKEVTRQFKETGSFDLATAARVVRIVSSLARKAADQVIEEDNAGKQTGEPQQKAGAHDPNPDAKDGKKQKSKTGQGQGFFDGTGQGRVLKLDLGTLFTSVLVSYLLYSTLSPGERSKDITWQEFRNQFLDRGLVEKLTVINSHKVKVQLNREAVKSVYPDSPAGQGSFYYYFSIGDVNSFENHLDKAHEELGIPSNQRIPVAYAEESPWSAYVISFGPTLLIMGMGYYLLRRSAGGAGGGSSGIFNMGKSRAKKFNHETDIKVTFKDVAGMDEAKVEITEFVSFLKEPAMYQKLGAKIPRGAILAGPPGTGKTLLAKATAGESGVPFFSVSGSEFVEMFVGVGASRVRDLFATARKNTPCIIFIDEIDAIGKSRGKNQFSGGNDEREATLNQILTEMDGFNTTEQVVVLAGTNRSDVLDKALMRPGRFDRHIHIDPPTMEGRKHIFDVHLKKIVTSEDLDHLRGRLAALTPGFSGADIANCVNEAALIAARNKAESVAMTHFEQAIERVIGGLEKKSLVLSPDEKKVVAYHEAGHAICGWFFKWADPLLKVSIIPRGQQALGYAQYLPNGESYLLNVNQLMDRMAMTLGGRISEELHFETVTSGASDDFSKVTRMATAMVTKWGMSSKIGTMYYEDDAQQQMHKPFSEETARNIDAEVRRIVDEAYKQCRDLLEEKRREIGLVAEELLAKEALSRDDLVRILGPRPFEERGDFSKYFGGRGDREGVSGSTPGGKEDGVEEGSAGGAGPLGPTPTPTIFKR